MADKWSGKTRGNLLGYKIFAYTLKWVGVKPAYALLRFITFYFFLFARQPVKVMRSFYTRAFGYSWWQSTRMIYWNFNRLGESILDKLAVAIGRRDQYTYDFEQEKNLRAFLQEYGHGLLISGHCGNWDIAAQFMTRLEKPVNLLMYEAEVARIRGFLDAFMGERTFNIIAITEDGSHIYAIKEALERKEIICLHGDRYVKGQPNFTANFLGSEALFPAGPFQLAARLRIPFVYVYCMKEGARHYRFFCNEGKVFQGTPQEMFAEYVQGFEEKVKQYPDQWFNYYDFWAK